MDEYSPRNYDIAVLKYLCDELCREGTQTLIRSNNYWVNDLASDSNLKLNELLGYFADVTWSFKIKHTQNKDLISFVDEYIDETYALFGQMEVSFNDVEEWKKMASLVSSMLTSEGHLVH